MSRVFLSHSSRDSRQAMAVKKWLVEQEPGLAEEIFLDLDPHTGIRPGERWRQALQQANARCEAVICLLSKNWEASRECQTEFRYAENLGKTILCARLEPVPDTNITSEWQRCDLFPADGPTAEVEIADGGQPVVLDTVGLQRLLEALRALGIGAEHFPWPPPGDPDRAPYRGWAPLEEVDAGVFFGRDAQILRGLDVLHGMRSSGVECSEAPRPSVQPSPPFAYPKIPEYPQPSAPPGRYPPPPPPRPSLDYGPSASRSPHSGPFPAQDIGRQLARTASRR